MIETLTAHTDGACKGNPGIGSWAVVLSDGSRLAGFELETTNNRMEYHGIIAALRYAVIVKPETLVIRTDSQLIARILRGEYKAKSNMDLATAAMALVELLGAADVHVRIEDIPREQNRAADALAKAFISTVQRIPQ